MRARYTKKPIISTRLSTWRPGGPFSPPRSSSEPVSRVRQPDPSTGVLSLNVPCTPLSSPPTTWLRCDWNSSPVDRSIDPQTGFCSPSNINVRISVSGQRQNTLAQDVMISTSDATVDYQTAQHLTVMLPRSRFCRSCRSPRCDPFAEVLQMKTDRDKMGNHVRGPTTGSSAKAGNQDGTS